MGRKGCGDIWKGFDPPNPIRDIRRHGRQVRQVKRLHDRWLRLHGPLDQSHMGKGHSVSRPRASTGQKWGFGQDVG